MNKLSKEETFEKIKMLHDLLADGKLMYEDVNSVANDLGLILAEHGDGADYSTAEAYCYWNKSGNSNDKAGIYIEHNFDKANEDGKQTMAGLVMYKEVYNERIYDY